MDLTTKYLGLTLKSPLVPSASYLSKDLDNIKKMEDSGAGAVVLYSLFEEQIRHESYELFHHATHETHSFAESQTFFPEQSSFHRAPDEYLSHIQKAKDSVSIPIIGSLNCSAKGGWIEYAQKIEQAGADALELNIYCLPTDMEKSSQAMEDEYLEIVKAVRESVKIPLAIKVSPFFTNFSQMARKFDGAGANGLVLFNRFFQPEIDIDHLEVHSKVSLSSPHDHLLPMRWIAILNPHLQADLAATSGIYQAEDVVKMLMVGARVTMFCSALIKNGIDHLKKVQDDLVHWMEEKEYESVTQMQGSMNQKNCPDPGAFERAHYIRAISTFAGEVDLR